MLCVKLLYRNLFNYFKTYIHICIDVLSNSNQINLQNRLKRIKEKLFESHLNMSISLTPFSRSPCERPLGLITYGWSLMSAYLPQDNGRWLYIHPDYYQFIDIYHVFLIMVEKELFDILSLKTFYVDLFLKSFVESGTVRISQSRYK